MANKLRALNTKEIGRITKKLHEERGGHLKQRLPLPKTLSLKILSNGSTSAYISTPTTPNNPIGEGADLAYDTTIRIILFNLSFIRSKGLINLDPSKYVATRNAKLKTGSANGITKEGVSLDLDYNSFRDQIIKVLLDNIFYVKPNLEDLPEKLSTSVQEEFKNITTAGENITSIYNLCKNDESKLYLQKLFLHLLKEYVAIRDNEKYLLDLYKDVMSITTKTNKEDKSL